MKEFETNTGEEILGFVNEHIAYLVGKQITAFYTPYIDVNYELENDTWDTEIAFEIEDLIICIDYRIVSDILIVYGKKSEFALDDDTILSIIPSDNQYGGTKLHRAIYSNIIGKTIKDVKVNLFSEEFCINCVTDETRPAGGDYFDTIHIEFADDTALCICADDVSCGDLIIWYDDGIEWEW